MKTTFTGTSAHGDLTEALRHALKKAAEANNKDMAWTLQRTGGTQLELGSISVTIAVSPNAGGGPGDKDPK